MVEKAAARRQRVADPIACGNPDQRVELPPHAFGHGARGDHDRYARGHVLQGAQGGEPLRIRQGGIGQDDLGPPAALGQHAQRFGQRGRDPQVEPGAELALDGQRLDRVLLDHQYAQGHELPGSNAASQPAR